MFRRSSSSLEPRAALGERQVDERLAVDLEHVEDLVDDRRAGLPLLHRREARPALLVERADLAVEHAVRRLHAPSASAFATVGEALGEVVAVAG